MLDLSLAWYGAREHWPGHVQRGVVYGRLFHVSVHACLFILKAMQGLGDRPAHGLHLQQEHKVNMCIPDLLNGCMERLDKHLQGRCSAQLNGCVGPQIVTGNGNYVVGTNLHRFVYTVSCLEPKLCYMAL